MKTEGIQIFVFLLLLLLVSMTQAEIIDDNEAAAAQVQVINFTSDPAVLMPYDTATVTIVLSNTGTKSVTISDAELFSKDFKILSDEYGEVGAIGAGNTMSFTYTLQAGGKTGIFYPFFSVNFRNANCLRYPFKVIIQENPIEISVLNKPETWVTGKKEDITIHIGNPRDNDVSGVTIEPSGDNHEITPTSFFSGSLKSENSIDVPFSITPYGNNPVEFTVRYQNGINEHSVSYFLPVKTGEKSKKQADTVLSNVKVETEDDHYVVTGDVTNTGLENANAVIITSGDPAIPVFPYKVYAVGALKPDDFSSFEVTFQADANVTGVPLKAVFKDDDGNEFDRVTLVELDKSKGLKPEQDKEGISPFIIGVVVILATGVLFAIWYSRRRR